jgi:hypothetical protein
MSSETIRPKMLAYARSLVLVVGQFLRKRARFGLRTLLVAVTVVALMLGWLVHRVERQRRAVEAITERGGRVVYAHENAHRKALLKAGKLSRRSPAAPEPGPAWLRRWLGPHYFQRVETVYLHPGRDSSPEGWPLGDLPSLTSLLVVGGPVSGPQLESIGAAGNLAELHMIAPGLDEQGTFQLTKLHKLWRIDMEGGSISAQAMQDLCQIPNLEELTLLGTKVKRGGFARLSSLVKVHGLDVIDVPMRDEDVDQIAAMPGLKSVRLLGTGITSARIERLKRERPDLEVVYLDHATARQASEE